MNICPYENSPFCSRLSPQDREEICKKCRVFQFMKKADAQICCREVTKQLDFSDGNCVVILQGLQCTNSSQRLDSPKAFLLWQPGDLINAECLFGEFDEMAVYYYRNYITDGAYAIIPASALRKRFRENLDFAAMLFDSMALTRLRQTSFLLGTQLQNAKSALMYLLLFCQENNLPALTHQDFAYLTGLNRTTVTKTLKKILSSEDLSVSLREYIRSMYEDC